MNILGISAFYHDSAAALVRDGDIIAAAQEERFTRKKHDQDFPAHAVEYCLAEGGIGGDELDHVVFYEKPFTKFERLLETYIAYAPRGFRQFMMGMPLWLRKKLHLPRQMDIAASIQKVTEEVVLRAAGHVHKETQMKNLVLGGGGGA